MHVAVIGGGPAGLMAAETAAAGGAKVQLFDCMPSVGRKFLLAGKGGLNLTHSEPKNLFLSRYGSRSKHIAPLLATFGPDQVKKWANDLGIETFIGSSGRIFPIDLKSAPLLRTWLSRLRHSGVSIHVRHRWCGWDGRGALRFSTPAGWRAHEADAVILALGGGSWPQLGSDGAWLPLLAARGVSIAPLLPSNCGFDVGWSDHFRTKFAGRPVKTVGLTVTPLHGDVVSRQGEFMITESGLEGGVVYTVSAFLRDEIIRHGSARLCLDLAPDRELSRLRTELARSRGKRTLATHLQRRARIDGVKAGLLREIVSKQDLTDPVSLAGSIKSLPLRLIAARPIHEAISTAGGVTFESLDASLMVTALPGVFCAGEMLDWEAPTGGYLLTACLATGRVAGAGAVRWLARCRE